MSARQGTLATFVWVVHNARRALADPWLERTGATQLMVTAALILPVWAALAIAAGSLDLGQSEPSRTSTIILSMLAGELAFGAAVLSTIRAWVTREVAPLLASAGLCGYGIHSLMEAAGTSIGPGSAGRWIAGASLSVVLGFLFLSVVRHRDEKPRHRFVWAYPLNLTLLAVVIVPRQNLVLTATWSVCGITAISVGRKERERLKIWIGATMLCLAQARLALVVLPTSGLAHLGSHVLRVVATTLVLVGTTRALQESIAEHRSLVFDSLLAFQGSEARRRSQEQTHQETVHNLRSAIGAISVATHALVFSGESPSLSEEDRRQLARSLEDSLKGARRLIAREWDDVFQVFSLCDLVVPAVARERSSGVSIDLDVDPDARVRGDRGRAREVLEALLDNARRHATNTPLTIRAVTEGDWVALLIADRGPGRPAGALDRIFERGWTTARDGNGAGIGLHVARLLMEEQGGTLTAADRPGGGAVFLARFRSALSAIDNGSRHAAVVDPLFAESPGIESEGEQTVVGL